MGWIGVGLLVCWVGVLTWKVWRYRCVLTNLCRWQEMILEEMTRPQSDGHEGNHPTGVYALDEVALGWAERAERRAHRDVVLARVAASP